MTLSKEQRESLDGVLSSTLARTVDFLKFAETKNAAILTFASAWSVVMTNLLTGDHVLDSMMRKALVAALVLFACSALVSLWSFLPKLDLKRIYRKPDQSKNLLYFAHIAEFETSAYVERVKEIYAADPKATISVEYLTDMTVQVSANAVITKCKFYAFYLSAALAALAILVLTTTTIILACKFLISK